MNEFNELWQTIIKALEGKNIYTASDNKKNKIVEVTDAYLKRLSSKGNISPAIPKSLFEEIYYRLQKEGVITREQINDDYKGRRSSIVTVVLGKLPNVQVMTKPVRLIYND